MMLKMCATITNTIFLKSFTSQNIAPYRGGGESQTRYRFLVPPEHVELHGVHSLHDPHPPRSDSENSFEI